MKLDKGVNYMCNRNNNNDCDSCIMEILKVINVLQSNACPDSCLQSCDRPALGGGPNCIVCNTRPIMLYTCAGNGTPWEMPTSRSTAEGETSNVFRVEKCDGCCCTFRVLAPNTAENATYPYVATDSLFTMNVDCICSVRCLNDTYVECI